MTNDFNINIRKLQVGAASCFLHLVEDVECSSQYMLMESGERQTALEEQRKRIEQMGQHKNSVIFVAEVNNQLVGYIIAIGGNVKKTRHVAYIVIGILENYRGKGIGTALFHRMDLWARVNQLKRLELTVVTENGAGIALYKKCGFEIEGTKRCSLMIDGKLADEYMMAKVM